MPIAHVAPRSRVPALPFLAVMIATVVVLAAFPTPVRAQNDDAAAVEKVTKMNKKAVEEYENLNFEEARKILKDALDLCTQSGLDKHPITARTHVHLGVVILAGFKQRDLAIKQFKKALEIQPEIKLTKSLANPEIQEAFDEAVSQSSKPEPGDNPPEKTPDLITHEPITQGKQGKPVPIHATVDSSLATKRVVLNFRPDGAAEFIERDMTEASPGNWQSEIPSTATAGNRVAYYVDVEGDKEETLASKGTEEAPLVVVLKGAAPVVTKPPPDEGEGPHWYVALGIGSGTGYTQGAGEVNADHMVSPPGFALSGLGHVEPELGYFVTPHILLSVMLRFQYITGPTEEKVDTQECGSDMICSTAKYALAGFGKFTYLFGESSFHPFATGFLGGGYVRHIATFAAAGPVCGADRKQTCVDTVLAGPVFAGGGGGFLYNLSEGLALSLGTNLYLGFPTNTTFQIDVNAGIALEF